jgi:hypothetical protein
LLFAFLDRTGSRLGADPPRTLHVRATDAGADWLVCIGPDRRVVSREPEPGEADCSVRGRTCELYLVLWNRLAPGLEVRGDAALLDLWRHSVRVRWG